MSWEIYIDGELVDARLDKIVDELDGIRYARFSLPNTDDNRDLVGSDRSVVIKYDGTTVFEGTLTGAKYEAQVLKAIAYDSVYYSMDGKIHSGDYTNTPASTILSDICASAGVSAGECPSDSVSVKFISTDCWIAATFLAYCLNKDFWTSDGKFNIGDKGEDRGEVSPTSIGKREINRARIYNKVIVRGYDRDGNEIVAEAGSGDRVKVFFERKATDLTTLQNIAQRKLSELNTEASSSKIILMIDEGAYLNSGDRITVYDETRSLSSSYKIARITKKIDRVEVELETKDKTIMDRIRNHFSNLEELGIYIVSSHLEVPSGTSFPSNPSPGQLFYRTDLDTCFRYNGSSWDKIAKTSGEGNSFPSSPSVGDIFYRSDEGKFYRWNGSEWVFVASSELGKLQGTIDDIQDGSSYKKTSASYVDGSNRPLVKETDQLLDGVITETKIADDSISTPKLKANSVTAEKIAANSITTEKLVAGAVTSEKIAASSITTEKINLDRLTSDPALVAGRLWWRSDLNQLRFYDGSIVCYIPKFPIGDIYITDLDGSKINDGSIEGSKIASGAIQTDHLSAEAVTTEKLAANVVTAEKISAGAIQTEHLSAGAVTTEKLSAGAVTTEKLNAGAVTAEKLSANSVTTEKIVAQAVSIDKVAPTIGTKSVEFLYTKFKEYSASIDSDYKHEYGTSPYTREILAEEKLRYRLRKLGAELKCETGGTYMFCDVFVIFGGQTVSRTILSGGFTASLEQIGSGDYTYDTDTNSSYPYLHTREHSSRRVSSTSTPGAGYERWILHLTIPPGGRDWSAYDYFGMDYYVSGSNSWNIRIKLMSSTSDYFYFDVSVQGYGAVVKPFSEMSQVGNPNKSNIYRIDIEMLDSGFNVEFWHGCAYLSNVPFVMVQRGSSTSFEEVWSDALDYLGSENETLELEYRFGCGNSTSMTNPTAWMRYPASDVRGVSYLEDVP
ncbi:MAG: hypothetical protein DRP01_01120 [Archaeoglobales archaeon]|nr:MAG: hypothetical protein DRP01_01120 [Archaeoglobales archaeon]